MSKIGDIRLQLDEQAEALGLESLEQAQQAGCEIDWDKPELIEPLEAAHRAWEKERDDVLASLNRLHRYLGKVYQYFPHPTGATNWWQKDLERAIKFIEEAHE